VVLGARRSGRSTLLRIAAGLERPDDGRVTFAGADLSGDRGAVGRRLCYCLSSFSSMEGDRVLDHVAAPLLARGASFATARQLAMGALERVDAEHLASLTPDELDGAERVWVAIARALAPNPQMIVIDDPTAHSGPLQRDPLLRLLRTLPAGDGPSVLMCTDDAMSVTGADRVITLEDGEVRSTVEPQPAEVVPLNARRAGC
jgi:predicted ABC-type transport system involved in lysophospholipase L1 biosynthesis ATPase subunit